MNINRLETPALIVEEKIFYKNLETMKNLLSGKNIKLRPHFKSNKSAWIAHEQMKYGAKGITCAKLGEAIDLADSGTRAFLLAHLSEENNLPTLALDETESALSDRGVWVATADAEEPTELCIEHCFEGVC